MVTGYSTTEHKGSLSGHGSGSSTTYLNTSGYNGTAYTNSTSNNNVNYSGSTESTQVSYVSVEVLYFDKSFFIEVYDAQKSRSNQKAELIWRGNAIIIEESSELRGSLACQLISLFKHFGYSVKKQTVAESVDGIDKLCKKYKKMRSKKKKAKSKNKRKALKGKSVDHSH